MKIVTGVWLFCALNCVISSTRCEAATAAQADESLPQMSRLTSVDEVRAKVSLVPLAKAALDAAHKSDDVFRFFDTDYEQKLASFLAPKDAETTLKSDVKTESAPFDAARFRFNGNLKNTSVHGANPENLVMFYQGEPKSLDFRYGGWAVVALADGSVKSVTPLLAKSLRWHWNASDDALEREGGVLNLSSPEQCAATFINALNSGRFASARRCIYDVQENQINSKPLPGWDANRMALMMKEFEVKLLGTTVNAAQYQIKIGKTAFIDGGTTAFVFENDGWRIVAAPTESAPLMLPTNDSISLDSVPSVGTGMLVSVPTTGVAPAGGSLTNSAVSDTIAPYVPSKSEMRAIEIATIEAQRSEARRAGTLSLLAAALLHSKEFPLASVIDSTKTKLGVVTSNRLKQLGLGAMQLAQEYDEVFEMTPDNFQKMIKPYLGDDSLYGSPLSDQPFSMNSSMARICLSDINEPARTVLFYDGSNGQLNFNNNGRAAVGFVDGHVKFVTPQEAADLIWNVPHISIPPLPDPNSFAYPGAATPPDDSSGYSR